ncbi:hypothetical protein ACWGNE_25050 [Streptomyces xiamenensis]|uniref:hypothetical protein n=1 Tax=Streptomyces xiamenensis TaxID=408015 RepID=UPI0036D11F84
MGTPLSLLRSALRYLARSRPVRRFAATFAMSLAYRLAYAVLRRIERRRSGERG